MQSQAALDATLVALSDATRRAILSRLAEGEATVNELARPFAISQPAISRHIKVLEEAGLVRKSRDAQFRSCRLETLPLQQADDWMAAYRVFFGARFDQLERIDDGKEKPVEDLRNREQRAHDTIHLRSGRPWGRHPGEGRARAHGAAQRRDRRAGPPLLRDRRGVDRQRARVDGPAGRSARRSSG